ncbi:MAG: DUF222 domain-containing protein, partial [Microbacteriaceae bacterium]
IDRLDRVIEELKSVEADLARTHARRIRLLAQADALAESMVEDVIPVRANQSQRREMAHRSAVADISCALRIPQQSIAADVAVAVRLAGMTKTMTALQDGRISFRHATTIAVTCMSVPDASCDQLESQLVPIAEQSTVARLRRKARDVRERMHPVSITERTQAATGQRRVSLEAADDGMGWLHHYLPIAAAVGIYETTNQIAKGVQGATESRTLDQLRCDVLTDLIDLGVDAFLGGTGSPDSAAGDVMDDAADDAADVPGSTGQRISAVRPSVYVTVPVMTLMGLSDEPAALEGYGPIDPEIARQLAAEAPSFYRILTDPVTGTVLDIDRKRYRPPADMRRWLRVRDQTCRFPFCGRRAIDCDIDHTLAWEGDGKTRTPNLAHLCGRDHGLKHGLKCGASWHVKQTDGGVLHWTSPTGRGYTTKPETPIGMHALRDAMATLDSTNTTQNTRANADADTDADDQPPF